MAAVVCSAQRWVGNGPPQGLLQGWSTAFQAVAVKVQPDDEDAEEERKALARVAGRLEGRAGPHHLLYLLEALPFQDGQGNQQLLLITP